MRNLAHAAVLAALATFLLTVGDLAAQGDKGGSDKSLSSDELKARKDRFYLIPGGKLDVDFPDPNAKAAAPSGGTASPGGSPGSGSPGTGAPADGPKRDTFPWSKMITAAAVKKEIEATLASTAEFMANEGVFVGNGARQVRDKHGWLAVLFQVMYEYDGPEGAAEAAPVRDLLSAVPMKFLAKVKPDGAMFSDAQAAQDAAQKFLKGEKASGGGGKKSFQQLIIYNTLMQRMEMGQDKRIKPWTASAEEFGKNLDKIELEAQLLAVMGEAIMDKGYSEKGSDDDSYRAFAKQFQEDAIGLVKAAKDKDAEAARKLAGSMSQQCSKCHEAFR
jgi:cytochrome c556